MATKRVRTSPVPESPTEEGIVTLSQRDLLAYSESLLRESFRYSLGKSFWSSSGQPRRDMYKALGYKDNPIYTDFNAVYERQDVCKRVVDLPVQDCWRKPPLIYEEEGKEGKFEGIWIDLEQKLGLYHYLQRLDRLARFGRYSVLFLGFNDGTDLNEPVNGTKELLFVMPYGEGSAQPNTWVRDLQDPRYGQPETYKIQMADPGMGGGNQATSERVVHWTRIIHVVEDPLESDVYGIPALKPVYNRLMDLEKLVGGSAEMFWRGAFPGHIFKKQPDATWDNQTLASLQDQIYKYVHGLSRYMRVEGLDVDSLAPQVASPKDHVAVQIQLISAATGIPARLLTGSERGELASSQDQDNWAAVVAFRQESFVEPRIVRQVVDRLMLVGVLPELETYEVFWPDVFAMGEQEQADIAQKRTETLAKYADSINATQIFPVIQFLQDMMGYTAEQAQDIVDAANAEYERMLEEENKQKEEDMVRREEELAERERKMAGGEEEEEYE